MENFRLRVFRAVAQHRNFRIAAEQLLLTQPAVTQQIKALEAELGVPLFERTGGRVALTPAGETLLPFAERLKDLADEALQAVATTTGTIAGELTISASQTIGQYLLPRIVAEFLRGHPKVKLNIVSGNTQDTLEALAAHRVQIALIEGPPMRNDVHVESFLEDHMVCIVPAGHEWANEEIDASDLQRATLIMRELGSGSRRIVETALEAAGQRLKDLDFGMTFDSTEALLSAVEAGLGVGFVSRWAVRNQLALGTLQLAHIRGLKLTRMFSIATASGPEPSGAAGEFHRFLLQNAEELAPRATGRGKRRP